MHNQSGSRLPETPKLQWWDHRQPPPHDRTTSGRREASKEGTDIIAVAEINNLHQATMGYPSEHPPPYRVSRHSKQISVTTSLMFSQMSSPRRQMMDVLNEQRSTPVLGAASRYPKDLIFKTYISTWTIIAKRQMS